MPTYDYKCTVCSYSFEFFQPINAEPIKKCPKCNGEVKRLIGTGLSPIFKGSGFYQTDYKNSSKSSSTSKPSNGSNGSGEKLKDSTKSDS